MDITQAAASSAPPSPPLPTAHQGRFLLVACQGGAEGELIRRQAAVVPQLRKAAWRRGVVTFRLEQPPSGALADVHPADVLEGLVFARTCIHSLGQVTGDDDGARIQAAIDLAGPGPWQNVHVWSRDPSGTAPAEAIRNCLLAAAGLAARSPVAAAGDRVLDCVLDSPDRWWVGWHHADSPPSRWPGGIYPGTLAATAVSRAWLKLDEAIATCGLRLEHGQRAVELGAAPGGASQRLLEAGLHVVGIDPALVDPVVAANPRFTHWRKRARDVKLREFRGFDWVVCDMNIDPVSTLESLGRIVTAAGVRPRGIIATLKLPEWSRAAALPEWLATFQAWGFRPHARQLSTGGREVCVVARSRRDLPT